MFKFNKIYYFIILTILLIIGYFIKNYYDNRPSYININNIPTEILKQAKSNDIIDKLNKNNDKIGNLAYNAEITIKSLLDIRIQALVEYEKYRKFRLKAYKFNSQICDLGSNKDVFWYWSKYGNPDTVYYCKHEDSSYSGLKIPLNPEWIMESLGINYIDINNKDIYSILNYRKFLIITEYRKSTVDSIIKKITLIDPAKPAIIGHYILDNLTGKLISSIEIKEFYQVDNVFIPKTMNIIWYEEKLNINVELDYPIINSKFNPNNWKIISSNNYVDIGQLNKPQGEIRFKNKI